MTAVKAAFGRRIPLVNCDKSTPIPGRFVLKLSHKLGPPYIRDSLSETVVLDHILDLQTLDTYDLVLAYGLSRELVLIVPSAVCNFLMDASNLQTGFITVLGAFFLCCMTALCFRQFLCITCEELGVAVGVSIGGNHHRLQSQIKPHHLRCDLQWLDVFFYQDGNKIAVCFIFGDGDTARLTSIRQGAMPHDGKRSIHLCQYECVPIPVKSIAHVGSGLLVTFLFEDRIASASFKEIAKGFIKMSESLLERN